MRHNYRKTVRLLWTWLWGRYHIPQNVFLVSHEFSAQLPQVAVETNPFHGEYFTLCFKKSDAKIQITITTAYLIRIKYPLSGFDYHLSDVNVANFNKIHRTVSEQQLFSK